MQRHQRNAPSWVRLGTIIGSIALALTMFGVSPSHAAKADGQASSTAPVNRPGATPQVASRTVVPKWVGRPGTTKVRHSGTSNANVDWQWTRGGWQIKFNWAETRQMARGFSYCTAIAALLPTGVTQAVAASCGLLWIMADITKEKGNCVSIFVPISLIHTSIGSWSCPH